MAPTGRDAQGVKFLLDKAHIPCAPFIEFDKFASEIGEETGAIVIAEEAFNDLTLPVFIAALEDQPVWSDIPVIVLTRPAHGTFSSRKATERLASVIGNIMFLERPLQALTLISAVRTTLNARKKQYQGRDYLLEKDRAQEELLEAQALLIQSNRELEHFAMMASHDLQAPLRKVAMFAEHLQEIGGKTLGAEGLDDLMRIQKSVRKMQELVEGLLNLSRVTRQKKPFKPVDLRSVLADVLADLHYNTKDVQGKIHVTECLTIDADEMQIHQLFQNLLQNSLKFHRDEVPPVINISCSRVADLCRIEVKDNGIGFNSNKAEFIFRTFTRLHGAGSSYTGTGMGLAIVKKIVERHNGTIDVQSTPGEGSVFTILLPIHQSGDSLTAAQ